MQSRQEAYTHGFESVNGRWRKYCMGYHINKWPMILVAAMFNGMASCDWPNAASHQFAGVKDFALEPVNVALPSAKVQEEPRDIAKSSRYVIQQDGAQFHLYFVGDGANEKVVGEVPALTAIDDPDFHGFTDVVSPPGITTYVVYEKYKPLLIDGSVLVACEIYALKRNSARKVVSNVQPAAVQSLDERKHLTGTYLDQQGNLFVLTADGILCAIRDGQILAKADVRRIGVKPPPGQSAFPVMFSDANNTYLLVQKAISEDAVIFGAPVTARNIKASYRIKLQ